MILKGAADMKRLLPALSALLLAALACSLPGGETPVPPASAPPPVEMIEISVYFQDIDRFAVGSEPYEVAVTRSVPAEDDLPQLVLEQLFLGPTAAEQADGLNLVLSGATGFSDFDVEDGIARVYLTGECNSGGSTYTIGNLIFANLAQFSQISAVKIYDQNGETEVPDGTGSSIPFCLEP
jgi:hypothetical protein